MSEKWILTYRLRDIDIKQRESWVKVFQTHDEIFSARKAASYLVANPAMFKDIHLYKIDKEEAL